jgi:septum formation protein
LKSDAYPLSLRPDDILLTADTTVVLDGRVLGKPRDRAEAIEMLNLLSGTQHKVITGVALRSGDAEKSVGKNGAGNPAEKTAGKREVFRVESTVWFRELTAEEIEHYVDTFSPMDKAGAYGVQEWIGYIGVSRIEGSFFNVMGMPMQAIYARLEKFVE